MNKITSIDIFFLCLAIGIVISAFKVDVAHLTKFQILDNIFYSFMYNFLITIPASIAAMFLWEYYKKKQRNEIIIY